LGCAIRPLFAYILDQQVESFFETISRSPLTEIREIGDRVAHELATEWQGVSRAGHWASRVLLVLGGVVAGTATAWMISGASASADSAVPDTGIPPVSDTASTAGLPVITEEASCEQEATAWSVPPVALPEPVAGSPVVRVVRCTLGVAGRVIAKSRTAEQVVKDSLTRSGKAPDLGKKVWNLLHSDGEERLVQFLGLPSDQETGQQISGSDAVYPVTTEVPAIAEALPVQHVESVAVVSAPAVTTLVHHDQVDLPATFAPAELPSAPLPVPAVPGTPGPASGAHFDGPAFSVPVWFSAAFDNAKTCIVHVGLRCMPLTPGSQPGVAPD
jgi:hypothetical protein